MENNKDSEGLLPIPEQGDNRYEVKTIVWHDDPGRFNVMIVAFEAHDGGPWGIENFPQRSMMFVKVTGGIVEGHYDPYRIPNIRNEANLAGFLKQIQRGFQTDGASGIPWEQVQDGFKYTPQFVEGML